MGNQSQKTNKNISTKSIREYVYIDETEMNSILAQFKDGIPKVIRKLNQTTSEASKTDSEGYKKTGGIQGGIPKLAEGKLDAESQNSHQKTIGNSDMSQNAIDTVYSDHAIDIIEDELNNENLIKNHAKQSDGTFVKLEQKFSVADFELLKDFTNNSSFDDFINETHQKGAQKFKNLTVTLHDQFPETIFIKLKNSLVIGDEHNFRYNKSQLQTANFTDRKLTVIGRVEAHLTEELTKKIESSFSDTSSEDTTYSNTTIDDSIHKFGGIMPLVSMYCLLLVFQLKNEDRIIRPLAMYFE